MRDALAERLLATVMAWGPEDVARERPPLQAMAAFKYDEYQQFAPGQRFVESLALWLGQFAEVSERKSAYEFVMRQLIFVSNAELQHFIAMSFRDYVRPLLLRDVAVSLGRPMWDVSFAASSEEFAAHQRRCLVLGLSDGARLDVFRRTNQELSHEQIWQTYQMPADRAESIETALVKELSHFSPALRSPSRFSTILLLDDFAGSGLSFLRDGSQGYDGKIATFAQGLQTRGSPLRRLVADSNTNVIVLLYVATDRALEYLRPRLEDLGRQVGVLFTLLAVHRIPESVAIHRADPTTFTALLEAYYTAEMEDEHTRVSGQRSTYGFGECGLPLVLTHNAPNNSVHLLWSQAGGRHALFPRVSRHVAARAEG